MIRIWETPHTEVTGMNFNNLIDCMWYAVVTFCNVGYGELYAVTYMGKFSASWFCFWGYF